MRGGELTMLTVAVARSLRELESLDPEWSALCDRVPHATPFSRPEWLIPWAKRFAPPELAVLVARASTRFVGILPTFVFGRAPERTLALLGAGLSDYGDAIVDTEYEAEAAASFAGHLAAMRVEYDRCAFDALPPWSMLRTISPPPGMTARTEEQLPCPVLELDRQAPTSQWAKFRKYQRRAERIGVVALRRAERGERAETVRRVLDIVSRRHAHVGALTRELHDDASSRFEASGGLALYVLSVAEEFAAALYGFVEKRTLYCYAQAWSEAFAEVSPGLVLVGRVLEEARRVGIAAVDMLRGREPYKYAWGAVDRGAVKRTFV